MTAIRLAHFAADAELPASLIARLDALTSPAVLAEGPDVSVAIGREGGAWIAVVVYSTGATDVIRIVAVQRGGPSLVDVLVALQTIDGDPRPLLLA